jgi:hypothetical protein
MTQYRPCAVLLLFLLLQQHWAVIVRPASRRHPETQTGEGCPSPAGAVSNNNRCLLSWLTYGMTAVTGRQIDFE